MEDSTKALGMLILGIVLVCLSFSTCTARISLNDNATLVEMVRLGIDPVAARCAVSRETSQQCAVIVGQELAQKSEALKLPDGGSRK